MKKSLLLLFFTLLTGKSISQDMRFFIHDKNKRSTSRSNLEQAKTLEELIPGYPSAWISTYDSTVITLSQKGVNSSVRGSDNQLSQSQVQLLNAAQLASELKVSVYYKYLNPVTNILEQNKILILFSVLPEKTAEFPGGKEKLYAYLAEHCFEGKNESSLKTLRTASIQFSVDESGKVINAILKRSSGSEQFDRTLMNTLKTMPEWNAAEEANGRKVQQDFIMDTNPSGVGGC